MGTPLVRRDLLEDGRRWALIFAWVSLVVAVLVSLYDVEARSYGTLLTLSMLPVLVYLTCPFSLHPNSVFLPPAVLFAVIVAKTASRFKKYL